MSYSLLPLVKEKGICKMIEEYKEIKYKIYSVEIFFDYEYSITRHYRTLNK